MKILLLGGQGQLGRAIIRSSTATILHPRSVELDITDEYSVSRFLKKTDPDVVINCAAIHDIAKCDQDESYAWKVNSQAVFNLVKVCIDGGIKFVQISTDQVMKGPGIAYEDGETHPYNVYTSSKLAAEEHVVAQGQFVVRVSGLYGVDPCRGKDRPNFVEQMIECIDLGWDLHLPANRGCSPGYCEDITTQLTLMIFSSEQPNVVNLTPSGLSGTYSWYHLASDIVEVRGSPVKVLQIPGTEDSSGVVNMGTRYNWSLPSVKESLRVYLNDRGG